MHPLQELERHYIDVRRRVESGQLPPAEGLRLVREQTTIDAAGATWCVDTDPRRSTADRAAFIILAADGSAVAADPASFAFAPAAAAPTPTGGFQLAGSPTPSPFIPPAKRGDAVSAPAAAPESEKRLKKEKPAKMKKEKPMKKERFSSGGLLSRVRDIRLTPLTISAAVGVFVLIALAFVFLRGGSDAQTPAGGSTSITPSSIVESTIPSTETSTPVDPSQSTLPTTLPGSETTVPGLDSTVATVPVDSTVPGASTTPVATTPATPAPTTPGGLPGR